MLPSGPLNLLFDALEYVNDLNQLCGLPETRDAGTGVHYGGTASPCPLKGGATGSQVPLHTSIISNFMIYQDQFQTYLLQLFAHT